MTWSHVCVAQRGVVDLCANTRARGVGADVLCELGKLLLEVLLELVGDVGMIFGRKSPARHDSAETEAPVIHIALR